MTDLITRLRDLHMQCDGLSLYAEAADEIERLRAALRPFAETDLTSPLVRDTFGFDVLRARAALAPQETP